MVQYSLAMVEAKVEAHKDLRWHRYDTKHSPFLELQTPFTVR